MKDKENVTMNLTLPFNIIDFNVTSTKLVNSFLKASTHAL